jgi:hypothetical protein
VSIDFPRHASRIAGGNLTRYCRDEPEREGRHAEDDEEQEEG